MVGFFKVSFIFGPQEMSQAAPDLWEESGPGGRVTIF